MRRRELLLLGSAAALWPLAAAAQPSEHVRRLGVLTTAPNAQVAAKLGQFAAFLDEIRRLGWTEGQNLAVDIRYAGVKPDVLRSQAAELAATKPDIIVAITAPAVKALLAVTRTISIVTLLSDPVGSGFVASYAHPGGNITGFSPLEPQIAGKLVEILKEISPETTRAVMIIEPVKAQALMRDAAVVARGRLASFSTP